MKIQFIDVGANKISWTTTIQKLDHDSLYAAVKSSGALWSKHIDFIYSEKDNEGYILVGQIRKVGAFKVVQEQ